MAALKIYYDLISQPARAVLALVKVNGIPYESCPIQLRKGEHLSEEYMKVNPFHRVPTIIDDGFKLMESVAILRYLCRTRNLDDHWYPKDPKLQARVDEYLEWQHIDIRSNTMGYIMNKFMMPSLTGTPADKKLVDMLQNNMDQSFDYIENVWLKNDKKYLIGEQISIADLLGVFEAHSTRVAGYDPRINRPKLTSWMDRMRTELNPHYDELNVPIDKVIEKFKGIPPMRKK
ncbi:glutathione S-transferase theta-1-like [Hetaerina americana]|uniref:glutathione S-transferase theta-1-like n=1 Tax=Hetaerina americana TaxID=62018 RepID=UPI003A7F62B2